MDEQCLTRQCKSCGTHHGLAEFHLKSNGKFGRDSRCRSCVVRIKKTARRFKRARTRHITVFDSEIVGKTDEYLAQEFGSVFGRGIANLLEKGWLK